MVVAVAIGVADAECRAGFLVGQGSGNDNQNNVESVIDAYNTANGPPNLVDPTGLFKKTDDDAAFVFNAANGFSFSENSDGTGPITSAGQLHGETSAYFTYTGPETLYYYSVVSGPNFLLYTFMQGTNFLQGPINPGGQQGTISHVSFWSGTPGFDPFGDPIPEPTSGILAAAAIGLLAGRRWSR